MTPEQYKELFEWQNSLKPGDKIYAMWTNSHRQFGCIATVTKINTNSLRATLDSEIVHDRESGWIYPLGFEIKVPLPFNAVTGFLVKGHTQFNGAYPTNLGGRLEQLS